jgi:hypothetical protein
VSAVFSSVRAADERRGGVLGYPLKALFEEVAFVAYHFHWPEETILNLEHDDRRRWVKEISAINEQRNVADHETSYRSIPS